MKWRGTKPGYNQAKLKEKHAILALINPAKPEISDP